MRIRFLASAGGMLFALFANTARAEFDENKRSINGTGETLSAGEYELGIAELDYGIDNFWMIRAPSIAALVGFGRLELKRKFEIEGQMRASPYVFAETPRKFGIGGDYGWDFGEAKAHSVTVGGRVQFTPRIAGTTHGPRSHLHTIFLPNVEYDYYSRGNLSYAGIADYLPYLGHTWAFDNWHIGLIISPYTSMIPLPYAYLRF